MKIQLFILSVIMLCFFALIGCGTKNRSTDTHSRTFSTDEEKIEFLKRYVTLYSPVKATEFHIVYHDNSTGSVPGSSDWNIKVALLVEPENIQAWLVDFEEVSKDHCDFPWASEVLPNESRWNRSSIPRCYQRSKDPRVILSVYESEGILLKQMTSD
jgi:hypothetical protein